MFLLPSFLSILFKILISGRKALQSKYELFACRGHKGGMFFQLKAFIRSINNSLVYFLCCNTSYSKLAILAMSLPASQELPLRGWQLWRQQDGYFQGLNLFSGKVMFLLGRCKSNSCVVCPPGRMTMQSLRCPSSWPVSMLLRNSEFPAKGIFCFHLSFTVAVVAEQGLFKNRVPEESLV